MLARPAVAKAIEIRRDPPVDLSKDKEAQKILFGQRARCFGGRGCCFSATW